MEDAATAALKLAVRDPIFTEPSMWTYMQNLMQPLTPRIAQVTTKQAVFGSHTTAPQHAQAR